MKLTPLPPGFKPTLSAHTLSPCPWYLSTSTEVDLRLSNGATDFFRHHVTLLGSVRPFVYCLVVPGHEHEQGKEFIVPFTTWKNLNAS